MSSIRPFGTATLAALLALSSHGALSADMPTDAQLALAEPLIAPWTGPYGGVPPFDKVKVASLAPALEVGMDRNLAEVDLIATNPAPPTFDNTIAALERSGRALTRAATVYNVYTSTMNDDAVQAVERDMAPKLAAFQDKITQNEPLFRRIEAVYAVRETSGLDAEQQRLVWWYYTNFVRAGAKLDAKAKARLAAINQELAGLYTTFSQNVLADEKNGVVYIEREADLAGLPGPVRDAEAEAAAALGHKGQWAVRNTRSSVEPFLTYANDRALREKVWRMFVNRGDGGGANDNNATITKILALRDERARLLGYANHAAWKLEDQMAGNPDRAMALMMAVWPAAVARVHEEVADMQAVANQEGAKFKIEPWDYRYYAEKVRKAKYDLDETEITPYLQLEKLREGMFYMAKELFGFTFTPVDPKKVPVYHPDVRVWEVTDEKGGLVGLWYFDPYAREGKQSGAWMNAYRNQERFETDVRTIVSNNSNFVKGKPGEPVLISWTDATTLFHEFGHALHGLSSNVSYPTLSGTSVSRDYVEFPSQLLEHWVSTPEILNRYALNYKTGKPIPPELVAKIQNAAKFNQGFKTVEYLSSAIVDMKLHLAASAGPIDPDQFERATLAEINMPSEIVMRHRTPQFNHIFSGEGYSAGYYSYLWADTLTADAWESFLENGGPWSKEQAAKLKALLSQGNTKDPSKAYQEFRGREPDVNALMRDRGFPVPAKPGATSDAASTKQ
ncbi:MAG: M3 family metallopeptidase [Steroidobacteraceae bacterium]